MRCWRSRADVMDPGDEDTWKPLAMCWPSGSWNNAKLLSARHTEDTKVAPVQCKHRFNPLPICQIHQAGVGELNPQAPILCQDGCDSGEVRLVQRKKLKRAAVERGQQHPESQRVCPQKPGRLGNHRPTG